MHTWSTDAQAGWRDAAPALNAFDVAIVQHEYGIYPGADGEDVLPLLRRLTVPSIVVLHTVLSRPHGAGSGRCWSRSSPPPARSSP